MNSNSPANSPLNLRRQLIAGLAALPVLAQAAAPDGDGSVTDMWQRIRAQWLLSPRLAYFDTAAMAPSLRAVLAAQYRTLEALHSDPRGFYGSRYAAAPVQELLGRLAQWLGCDMHEVCGVGSGDAALTWVAELLPLTAGDDIVVAEQLPDSLLQYWQQLAGRRGCRLVTVSLPMPIESRAQVLEAYRQVLTDRTRIVCIGHVQPLDGTILPVSELCAMVRERGAVSLVEGSLALGAVGVAVRELGCDVYAGSLCHWLQGAAPSAVLYVRSALQATWPAAAPNSNALPGMTLSDWPRLQQRWPADFVALAAQFQALPTALQWHAAQGKAVIENRLRQLQTYLRINLQNWPGAQLLTCNQPGMQLHILAMRTESRGALQVCDWLQRNDNVTVGIASSLRQPAALLRISLNVGNSLDEVDRLIQGLKRALRA